MLAAMSMPERAVRAGAQHTRREILLTAARLFAERGFADVSVIEVAAAAGVFPNQVTYYFGGKDGLFVEVAGRLILEAGQAAEIEAQKANSVREYTRMLAASVLGPGLPAVLAFIEAMLIARGAPTWRRRSRRPSTGCTRKARGRRRRSWRESAGG